MHPAPAFRAEADGLLERAAAIGFAHLFVTTPAGPMVGHAPLTRHVDTLRFHVARSNRMAAYLDGATILASVSGPDGYVSPNWYAVPGNQVPTWNYIAIEIEGSCRELEQGEVVEQLDALAARHEPLANPTAPWHRDKMNPAVFAAMLQGIRGYEMSVTTIRGTDKLSQNKADDDRSRVASGLRAAGNAALAAAMACPPILRPR